MHVLAFTDYAAYFYPRSPCGERRWLRCWQLAARDISIHALLAESDYLGAWKSCNVYYFYPRSPCGERLQPRKTEVPGAIISIHALLAESDRYNKKSDHLLPTNFYPRSPCGERHPKMSDHPHNTNFYPRSPCGERPAGEKQRT